MVNGIRINGAVLAELRQLRCMSQAGLARASRNLERGGVDLAREKVSKYECETLCPSPANLNAIRLTLNLTKAEMRALLHTPALDEIERRAADLFAADSVGRDRHGEGQDQTHRRDALERILGSLTAAAGPWSAMPNLGAAVFTRVDAGLVTGHADVGDALVARYWTSDPRALLAVAASHAESLLALLDAPMPYHLRERLEVIAVEAHALVGRLAFRIGDRRGTRRSLAQASRLAEDHGDPALRAKALCLIARHVHSPLPHAGRGDSRRAVRLLAQARGLAASADPYTKAWLATCYAEEAAELGPASLDHCWAALADASAALDRATDYDVGFFSPRLLYRNVSLYLEGCHGRVSGLAGRFDDAERRYAYELRATPSRTQRLHALTSLATVRVGAEEPEGACQALNLALDESAAVGYVKGAQYARGVRQRFPGGWSALSCVRDLDGRPRPAV